MSWIQLSQGGDRYRVANCLNLTLLANEVDLSASVLNLNMKTNLTHQMSTIKLEVALEASKIFKKEVTFYTQRLILFNFITETK